LPPQLLISMFHMDPLLHLQVSKDLQLNHQHLEVDIFLDILGVLVIHNQFSMSCNLIINKHIKT
jgi:hypothetical protein